MKKKLVALALVLCISILSLAGCGNKTKYQESNEAVTSITNDSNGYFTVVREWDGKVYNTYQIVYANDTKVMYLIAHNDSYQQGAYAITPLYNADGTLQIYDGK